MRGFCALLLAAAAFLMGCSGPEAQAYGSLKELKAAYVGAQFDCADWEIYDGMDAADEFGECNGSDYMAIFPTREAALAEVLTQFALFEAMSGEGSRSQFVVGPNWVVKAGEKAPKVQKALGGELVTSETFRNERKANSKAYLAAKENADKGMDFVHARTKGLRELDRMMVDGLFEEFVLESCELASKAQENVGKDDKEAVRRLFGAYDKTLALSAYVVANESCFDDEQTIQAKKDLVSWIDSRNS